MIAMDHFLRGQYNIAAAAAALLFVLQLSINGVFSSESFNSITYGFINDNPTAVDIYWLNESEEKETSKEVRVIRELDFSAGTSWMQTTAGSTFIAREASSQRLVKSQTVDGDGLFVIRDEDSSQCFPGLDDDCPKPNPTIPDFIQSSRDAVNRNRLRLNGLHPRTVKNFTQLGFKKMKAPKAMWELAKDYYERNKNRYILEEWDESNSYVNHWECPTYMIPLPSHGETRQTIIRTLRETLGEWAGVEDLELTALYGIRLYTRGSILQKHVDRLSTHALSAIVNVDQDIDEPWPLQVVDNTGTSHEVFIEPGDIVLYESARVIHGREKPFNGRYFANFFIHFRPASDELWPWKHTTELT